MLPTAAPSGRRPKLAHALRFACARRNTANVQTIPPIFFSTFTVKETCRIPHHGCYIAAAGFGLPPFHPSRFQVRRHRHGPHVRQGLQRTGLQHHVVAQVLLLLPKQKKHTQIFGRLSSVVISKANPSCCPHARTAPFPAEKSIIEVINGVLLCADMNAATPLGRGGRGAL